jgi:hypothetical protein
MCVFAYAPACNSFKIHKFINFMKLQWVILLKQSNFKLLKLINGSHCSDFGDYGFWWTKLVSLPLLLFILFTNSIEWTHNKSCHVCLFICLYGGRYRWVADTSLHTGMASLVTSSNCRYRPAEATSAKFLWLCGRIVWELPHTCMFYFWNYLIEFYEI